MFVATKNPFEFGTRKTRLKLDPRLLKTSAQKTDFENESDIATVETRTLSGA
jgi:hypothetical protein